MYVLPIYVSLLTVALDYVRFRLRFLPRTTANKHITPYRHLDGSHFSVEGAPECGCVEEMPIIDNAACSK